MVSLALLAALVIRVLLAFTVEGYGVDMGCFGAWAGKDYYNYCHKKQLDADFNPWGIA